jgi:ATP-dependent Lhr-like helicase
LLLPEDKRQPRRRHLRALPGRSARRLMPVGRWSLLRAGSLETHRDTAHPPTEPEHRLEVAVRLLLRRYGVLMRELLARERTAPPWRALLMQLRRLEARGEVRGGRFVEGRVGEQFALPEAVESLRTLRRQRADPTVVLVSAADPLNLVGILSPGARVSPYSGQFVAYRAGIAVEVGDLGAVRSRLQGS